MTHQVYLPRSYNDTPDWWKRLCHKTNGQPIKYLQNYDVIIHYFRGFKDDVEFIEFSSEKEFTLFLLGL